MKKSISYWAFPGGLEGTKNVREAMVEAKQYGFDAIEPCVGETGALSLASTKAECAAMRANADEIGIEISSVASGIFWGYNFGNSDAKLRGKAADAVKKMLQIANWLGTDALLTIPAAVDVFFNPASEVVPYDVAYERAVAGIKKVLPVAEKFKVVLAIENVWHKFLMSPLEMCRFIDSFNSPYVGAYFDVGNVLRTGYPEQWIRILGQRIKRVHLKDYRIAAADVNGFVDLLEGDVNWPEVMRALKEVGYNGYLTAEMIPTYRFYPEVRLINTSTAMDAIMGRSK
jgi:hexulose-6-phosphate isomerase